MGLSRARIVLYKQWFQLIVSIRQDKRDFHMRTMLFLCLLASNLVGRDITTLDGKTYLDCRVSRVYPDSICVLFSGGGARVKLTNLVEAVRMEFGYDAEKATAFENAEAAREQRERALLAVQRQQALAQRTAAGSGPSPSPGSSSNPFRPNRGADYVGVNPAGIAAGSANPALNQFGGGYRRTGAQYVGVRIGGPGGGIYGITYGPTRPTP